MLSWRARLTRIETARGRRTAALRRPILEVAVREGQSWDDAVERALAAPSDWPLIVLPASCKTIEECERFYAHRPVT